jgi:hypothetical protein
MSKAVDVGRQVRSSDEIVQRVADRDRLHAMSQPVGRDDDGKLLGGGAQHLVRHRATTDHDAGLQHRRRHPRLHQDVPDLAP